MALTGFLVHGICAKDSTTALYALGEGFPQFLGSTPPVMCNLASQSFTAPSTFSQVVSCHDLTGAPQYIFNHPISLPMCDPALAGVTLSDIFSVPASPDVATVWMFGFSLPIICYLAAWGFGIVVNMFKHTDD